MDLREGVERGKKKNNKVKPKLKNIYIALAFVCGHRAPEVRQLKEGCDPR